jgi:transcriptional regulator GlxA family with amidase domain
VDPNEHGPRRVGIVIFNNVQDLDFVGPLEVFGTAAELFPEAFAMPLTLAERPDSVRTHYGLQVVPHTSFGEAGSLDLLIVPGGQGTRTEVHNTHLLEWLRLAASNAEFTASVCTGSFLLAAAGVLRDQAATTHWQSLDRLAQTHPDLEIRREVRWVDEGVSSRAEAFLLAST